MHLREEEYENAATDFFEVGLINRSDYLSNAVQNE